MRHIITYLFILLAGALIGQSSVSITVDRDSMTIGDKFNITYKWNIADGDEIEGIDFSSFQEVDNLLYNRDTTLLEEFTNIEIIDGGSLGISNFNLILSKEKVNIGKSVTITAAIYDVGAFRIPEPDYIYADEDKMGISLEQPIVYVMPPLGMEELADIDIQPIKDIIREKVSWRDYIGLPLIILGILGVLVLIYFAVKRVKAKPKREIVVEEIIVPEDLAHIIALRELDTIKSEGLWKTGDEKEYHTRLTRVMRQYIEDRYEIPALELTTAQLAKMMKSTPIGIGHIKQIERILNVADIVKFAKGKTGEELNREFLDESYTFVNQTKNVDISE